ncbi:histidine phosphatase family protein [Acidovorax sp. 69]|uniref:histidine phosphatase family protein n=1 Tax=Acidovorax sp. 69 TaxID=2035202 RepID=UPI0018E2390F|nr:histidine phosphatase family protein [Acidovorax sp. 69]
MVLWGDAAAAQAPAVFEEKLVDAALLTQVQGGGFVLYLRHGATDSSRADRAPSVDLHDCTTQRVLSDAGRKQASALGQILQRARIPVGEVIHSPLCRARESAQLTFANQPQLLRSEPLLAYTANLTTDEKNR